MDENASAHIPDGKKKFTERANSKAVRELGLLVQMAFWVRKQLVLNKQIMFKNVYCAL